MGTPFFNVGIQEPSVKKQERKKDGEKINCILLSELRVLVCKMDGSMSLLQGMELVCGGNRSDRKDRRQHKKDRKSGCPYS